MIEANAQIVYHQRYDLKGNPEQIICEWEGPKDGTLAISGPFMNEVNLVRVLPPTKEVDGYELLEKISPPAIGDIVEIGPYKLKIFEYEVWRDTYYLVRLDSPIGSLRATTYRLTRWFDLIYRCLIITAAV